MEVSDKAYAMMLNVAKASLENMTVHPYDYTDGGFLFCGVCGEPKETFLEFEGRAPIRRARQCMCQRNRATNTITKK